MMRVKRGRAWLVAGCLVGVAGCGKNPLAGDDEVKLAPAYVRDDSAFLPDGLPVGMPIAGVRVEVIDGPKAGMFAITGPDGSYQLGNPMTDARVRATKDGYESKILSFNTSCFGSICAPEFRLGQSPHTLWGDVFMTGSRADVQVAILDGPNAGKVVFTDAAGRYRFDSNVTSPPFNLMFSKAGYQSRRILVSDEFCPLPEAFGLCEVSRNYRVNASLTPVG